MVISPKVKWYLLGSGLHQSNNALINYTSFWIMERGFANALKCHYFSRWNCSASKSHIIVFLLSMITIPHCSFSHYSLNRKALMDWQDHKKWPSYLKINQYSLITPILKYLNTSTMTWYGVKNRKKKCLFTYYVQQYRQTNISQIQ